LRQVRVEHDALTTDDVDGSFNLLNRDGNVGLLPGH